MINPAHISPSDDTGSATFDRYCYQAQIAFPYCLDCALGGDVLSVVPEHIEDVAVQCRSGWRFLQIKTRDPGIGPWKLADITKKKGGGLHSLLRAYKVLVDVPANLELHLEGAVARTDLIEKVVLGGNPNDSELRAKLQSSLKLDGASCDSFLKRLTVFPETATRGTIRAHNILLLSNHAKHLPVDILEGIYDRILGLIFAAMQARLLPPNWKVAFLSKGKLAGRGQQLFLQKQLVRDNFRSIVSPITVPPQPLLNRVIDTTTQSATLLEKKLLVGGASKDLIQNAKVLRAQASQREYEAAAAAMYDDNILEDVRTRLLIRITGLVSEHGHGSTPAASIWNRLVETLSQQRDTIDSRHFFHRDPDLLLGEVCQLSDLCKTGWGIADA